MSEQKYFGVVAWFDPKVKKYGFIEWEKDGVKQKDMFCHYSDIVCNGYKTLHKGERVSFTIGTNNNGDPKATNVEIIKD